MYASIFFYKLRSARLFCFAWSVILLLRTSNDGLRKANETER